MFANQISKETKFKDLPDTIKHQIITISNNKRDLEAVTKAKLPDFESVNQKLYSLSTRQTKELFDRCVINAELAKEKVIIDKEEARKSVKATLDELNKRIDLFVASIDDNDLLGNMYEAIKGLCGKMETMNIKNN